MMCVRKCAQSWGMGSVSLRLVRDLCFGRKIVINPPKLSLEVDTAMLVAEEIFLGEQWG